MLFRSAVDGDDILGELFAGGGEAGGGAGGEDEGLVWGVFAPASDEGECGDGFADGDGVDPDGVVELCEALSFGLGVDGDAFPEVDGETASAEDVDEIEWEIEEEGDGEEDAVEQEEHGRVGRVCE